MAPLCLRRRRGRKWAASWRRGWREKIFSSSASRFARATDRRRHIPHLTSALLRCPPRQLTCSDRTTAPELCNRDLGSRFGGSKCLIFLRCSPIAAAVGAGPARSYWRSRGPHHPCRGFAMRSSEPKPHQVNKLPVSFDSEVRKQGCRRTMRTSEIAILILLGD